MGIKAKSTQLKVPIGIYIGILASVWVLFLSFYQGIETTRYPDAPLFIEQANGILQGWDFVKSNALVFLSPLGFTSTIALSFYISQSTSLLLFKVILALTHGLSAFLVAGIGKSMGMSKRFWVIAALCFSLDPFICISALDIQVETFVTFLVLLWAYLFLAEPKNRYQANLQAISFGVSGFYGVTIRPNILIPFILLSVLFFHSWQGAKFQRMRTTKSLLFFFAPLVAFEIMITKLYGGFVFLAANGGLNTVLTCKSIFLSQYTGLISKTTNVEVNRTYYSQLQALKEEILFQNPNLSFSGLNREYLKVGIETCLQNPPESLFILLVKSIALWRPFTVIGAYGISISLLSLLVWLPLSLATIWVLMQKQSRANVCKVNKFFIVLAVGFTISLIPSSTQIRHRVAFAEPFFWLFGLYAFSIVLTQIRKKNSSPKIFGKDEINKPLDLDR